jgi:hypothetical protein
LVELNGVYLIYHKVRLFDRTVAKGVREIDAKVVEIDYITSQYKDHWVYIGTEARNCFGVGLSARKLKHISRFNYHGSWNKEINKGRIESKCPHY